MTGLILATFYVCGQLIGGEALACGPHAASEPPARVEVMPQGCGYYTLSRGSALIDCGAHF